MISRNGTIGIAPSWTCLLYTSVEDADAAALGQAARGAPEEIMFQLFGAGLLEAGDFASLRIDSGHHMLYCAILTGPVHALEDN